jgi:hypothetical protein
LKYRVQNNVFVVEKLKEVQKSKILKILMFVVRQMETHSKHICLPCVFLSARQMECLCRAPCPAHSKGNEQANGGNVR